MITRQNINIKIKVFYNYIQNFIFSRGFKNEFMLYFRLFFNSDLRFYFNKFFKDYQQINIILSRQNKKIFEYKNFKCSFDLIIKSKEHLKFLYSNIFLFCDKTLLLRNSFLDDNYHIKFPNKELVGFQFLPEKEIDYPMFLLKNWDYFFCKINYINDFNIVRRNHEPYSLYFETEINFQKLKLISVFKEIRLLYIILILNKFKAFYFEKKTVFLQDFLQSRAFFFPTKFSNKFQFYRFKKKRLKKTTLNLNLFFHLIPYYRIIKLKRLKFYNSIKKYDLNLKLFFHLYVTLQLLIFLNYITYIGTPSFFGNLLVFYVYFYLIINIFPELFLPNTVILSDPKVIQEYRNFMIFLEKVPEHIYFIVNEIYIFFNTKNGLKGYDHIRIFAFYEHLFTKIDKIVRIIKHERDF